MDDVEALDELLIHEYGHHYSNDHLSEKYHNALCRLGAKLKKLVLQGALNKPLVGDVWMYEPCQEGGNCIFEPDLEYDSSGNSINCEKCGCTPVYKLKG